MDGPAPNVNSLTINSGKTLTGQGYKITCDGESSANVVINNDGNIAGNLDLEINTQTATSAVFGGSSGNCFRDVKLNHANVDLHLLGNAFIDGQLTIAAGQLTCATEAGSARDLTVEGHVSLTGTLNGSTAAISFGSITINNGGTYSATSGTTTITSRTSGGYSWYAPTTSSNFNHNNGLVKLTYTSNETYWQGTGFYDLEIAGSTHHEHRYDDLTDGSGLTIFNNFTITEGRVRFNQAGDNVTVHGLTKMVSGQYGNTGTAPSGTHNYGNVVIEGGTWKVTSGTCNMSGIRKLGGTLA